MSVLDIVCGHRGVPEVLTSARVRVGPAVRAAVDSLPPAARRVAGYHLGWWDESGAEDAPLPGNAVGPALTLAVAAATGTEDAVPAAVAVELIHNYTRLHDDVFDGDLVRHGRPTAWDVFGTGPALLAGDALLATAYTLLAGDRAAVREVTGAVTAWQEGQAADLSFEGRTDVTLPEGVAAAEHKTGSLMALSVVLGAAARPDAVPHLRRFGERLGLAFQLVDDVLALWGDPEATGKPVYADLDRRKKSLPVLAALATEGYYARELDRLYHRPTPLSAAEVLRVVEVIDRAGGRAHCLRHADALLAAALADLSAARLPDTPTAELAGLAHHLVHRDR